MTNSMQLSSNAAQSNKTILTEADIKNMSADEVREHLLRLQKSYLGAMATLSQTHQEWQDDNKALHESFQAVQIQSFRIKKLVDAIATLTSRENATRILHEVEPCVEELHSLYVATGEPEFSPSDIVSSLTKKQ